MVQKLLPLLPRDLGKIALILAILGAVIGIGLWLFGSRFSRTLISLVLVSVGGWVGMFLPRWNGWAIEGWATALGGAVVLGATGFLLHRFWVGVGLGIMTAFWAAVVTWVLCNAGADWVWPKIGLMTKPWPYVQSLWDNLPADFRKYLPFAGGVAFLSGFCCAVIWPRVGVVTLYSLTGVTMLLGLGLCAINFMKPAWVGMLPAKSSVQATTVLAMVAFGALLQWRIAPKRKGVSGKPVKVEHA